MEREKGIIKHTILAELSYDSKQAAGAFYMILCDNLDEIECGENERIIAELFGPEVDESGDIEYIVRLNLDRIYTKQVLDGLG